MITAFLHEFQAAQQRTGSSGRALGAGLPGSTIRRWQRRRRRRQPLLQSPGPKKSQVPDWPALLSEVKALEHVRRRSHGTGTLYAEQRDQISRRDLQRLVQEERDHKLDTMQRIHWLRPGLSWSIDATHYQGLKLIPLHDLASRYRFAPLVASVEDGRQIAAFLDAAFRQYGPPLFLKRDNGSPFNCAFVENVLTEHGVLPLNNPPHYPRYNGAMEKSLGDFKRALSSRLISPAEDRLLVAAVETTTHDLNHRPRRCLGGRTACEVYRDPALRLVLDRKLRTRILRLLAGEFCRNVQLMAAQNQHALATVWRITVQAWLRRQGLITVGPNPKTNQKPNQTVSPIFPKKWSHN